MVEKLEKLDQLEPTRANMSPPIERVIKSVAARIYLFKSLLDFLGAALFYLLFLLFQFL